MRLLDIRQPQNRIIKQILTVFALLVTEKFTECQMNQLYEMSLSLEQDMPSNSPRTQRTVFKKVDKQRQFNTGSEL